MALTYNFVQILGTGRLALSQRPKVKEVKALLEADCQRVVTILSPNDRPQNIGAAVEACGMQWHWLKVSHANQLTAQEVLWFKQAVNQAYEAMLNQESVLVHCSAGLHRTGMFAYALLRKGNLSQADALQTIAQMRPETEEALEEKYLVLAEGLY